MRYIITGGAGFIGSALVRKLISDQQHVLVIDKLSYAGNLSNLEGVIGSDLLVFSHTDLCEEKKISSLIKDYAPDYVLHLAAESHVDKSISDPTPFLMSNVFGTVSLLNSCLSYYKGLLAKNKNQFRFLHVSTDEVFGSADEAGLFTEESSYQPSSPYSASKASSDHFVRAWHSTYGLPVIITNSTNNYGPRQFPEKLIPFMIQLALEDSPLLLYGDGQNIRNWLHVDDHIDALLQCAGRGGIGETYNIAGQTELSNFALVEMLCELFNQSERFSHKPDWENSIKFTKDRPGHDFRYALNCNKIKKELGWEPQIPFARGLKTTLDWYLANPKWIDYSKEGRQQQRNAFYLDRLKERGALV